MLNRARIAFSIAALACVAASATPLAQVFRAASDLVVLQVAVHNRRDEPVADLTKNEFSVWEDGVAQEVRFFDSWDQPVAIGLVVDNSASMMPKRREVVEAAQAFVKGSNPDDHVFTVNFNERVSFGLPDSVLFSSDPDVLHRAVSTIGASGQTALYDAVSVGLERVAMSSLDQRVLVVISDGTDNRSRLPYKDVLQRAMRANTVIYAVGIFDPIDGGNRKALKELATTTGGMAFFPEKLDEVRAVLDRICLDVRHRYTIGYVSTNHKRDGAFRKIRVTAVDRERRRPLEARARTGYLAAGGEQSR
jgi:Ca-activated chloride channel family protein